MPPARDLPKSTDVVIIGGGIVGICTALFLAERGIRVVVCEKGRIGGEQSSRNWGWCRTMGRDPAEIPLAVESLRLWRGLNAMTGAETGYRTRRHLFLLDSPGEAAAYEGWLAKGRDLGIRARFLTPAEIAEVLPGAARSWAAAFCTESDGTAEPALATPAIAGAVIRRGGVVLTDCAVRSLETAAGRVRGVVTEHGPIACESVVLAGGAWSRLFLGNLGIDLPSLHTIVSVLRTTPGESLPDLGAGGADFSFRRRLDGGYTVARRNRNIARVLPDNLRLMRDFWPALRDQWRELDLRFGADFVRDLRVKRRWRPDEATVFEAVRVLDPAPDAGHLGEGWANLVRAYPAFGALREVERWAGTIDVTPDAVPVIAPVAGLPGLVVATGFSGHGFGVGPGAGRLAADLVTNDTPVVDPRPFRLNRFRRTAGL